MSTSRSCVSYPSRVRRNGSCRFRYQPWKARFGPCQKSQTAYDSPGRCNIRQPCPVQRARAAQGWRPPAIGQSPSGNVNGVSSAMYVASRPGSSRTTRTGNEAQQRPSFSTSRRVTTSPSHHMPVLGERQRLPRGGRSPALPARRPRALGHHALAFRAHVVGFVLREQAARDHLCEVVLVLPRPGTVRLDDDVEPVVGRVEQGASDDERRLQVHVPACQLPVEVPPDLDRVPVAGTHEAEHMGVLPRPVERRLAARPVLEVAPVERALDELAARPRLDIEGAPAVPLAGVVMRPAPANGVAVDAPQQHGVAETHASDSTNRRLGSCEMDVSIVVTVLNEEDAVDELYRRVAASLNGSEWEAIFVDDGSTDGTFAHLRALHDEDPRVRVVRFKRNFGQHPAMHAGPSRAQGDRIVTMDGDLQNEPEDIPKLLAALDRADVASGRRVSRRDSPGRTLPSRVINGLLRRFTGVRISDFGCAFNGYRRDAIVPMLGAIGRQKFTKALVLSTGV